MKLLNMLKYGPGARGKIRKRQLLMEARAAQFAGSTAWSSDGPVAQRKYVNYAAYLAHQAEKLDQIADRLREREDRDLDQFKQRFEACSQLAKGRCVLCLGARLGTEVRALHALGYFAVGIDINPGPHNPYVLCGDFHKIVFPDGSVDVVYTNALDHVFDLNKVISEVRRLLRPDGVFVVDMVVGFAEGYAPGEFESLAWQDTGALIERVCRAGQFTAGETRGLGRASSNVWRQVIFARSQAA